MSNLIYLVQWQGKNYLCVCVIMTTNFLELATTLKYLGANWLPEKKLILRPAEASIKASYRRSTTTCRTSYRRLFGFR